jgi:hypothetical protein
MRFAKLLRLTFFCCALASPADLFSAAAPGRPGWIRGVVRSASGYRLAGARILVEPLHGASAVEPVVSDPRGEFILAGLAPGVYRLTGQRDGYRPATFTLNTTVQSSVLLTLPALLGEIRDDEPDPARLPADRGWALRLPRRDSLREQTPAVGPLDLAQVWEGERARASLDGRISHAVGAGSGNRGSRASSLLLEAPLGPLLHLSLAGEAGERPLEGAGDLDRRSARIGTQLQGGAHDTLRIEASLAEQESTLEEGYEMSVRAYGARWERRLEGSGAMDMQFGFHSADVDPANTEDRLWQASGTYRVDLDARQMQFALRARRLQSNTPGQVVVAAAQAAGGFPSATPEAWAFDLSGREERVLSGPLSLDYGFAYHRRAQELLSQASDDALIPEAGLTLSRPDGGRWSAAVSLALDRPQERADSPAPNSSDDLLSRLGYRLGMDYPLGKLDMNVAVSATYHPYAYAAPGGSSSGASQPLANSLLIHEGGAESLDVGMAVEKRFKNLVAAVGSNIGQIEGFLVTGYFDEMPVQQVRYNLVRYWVASAHGYRPDTGTRVRLDYQRFLNNPEDIPDPPSLSYSYQRVDLAVEQDLPFLDMWNARWRALLALETRHTDPLDGDNLADLRSAGIPESERRLSGGVAIRF